MNCFEHIHVDRTTTLCIEKMWLLRDNKFNTYKRSRSQYTNNVDGGQHKPTQHNDDVNHEDCMGEMNHMKMLRMYFPMSSNFVRTQPRNFTMDMCSYD